ncbi:carboxypeptidase S [Rhodocollybia butyracea]|uniref:Carboxypeptidase S n=1 Tax=Rhodocollybia butyracea TaxID=206335 RepID=A0A9P5UCB9_9AGAR|nr:carboxypeptidase S [Rhodocollybia butyracea]
MYAKHTTCNSTTRMAKGDGNLPTSNDRSRSRRRWLLYVLLIHGAIVSCSNYFGRFEWPSALFEHALCIVTSCQLNATGICTQVGALYPQISKNAQVWTELTELLETEKFENLAVNKLSGLIQIPSVSYDDMLPPGEDPRWETMGQLHDYLIEAFPLVHETLSLTKVDTYGLIYEWTGTDSSLNPYILAAHQDVVPVNPETLDSWIHPPFLGYFDGTKIWGRGASDDKASLTAIMLTLETLIGKGWTPARTLVLAFGYDEESAGNSANALAKVLEDTFGQDAFAFIIDEGGGFKDIYGTIFATPSVAEKGYVDVKIDVTSPGGHSSVPPAHTTIGYLALLITELEKNPYPIELVRGSVLHDTLLCYASHGESIPHKLKKAIIESTYSDNALRKVEELLVSRDSHYSSLVGTTQAVDIITGGVKANALPESAYAIINHRISTDSSVKEVLIRDGQTISDLAHSLNLTLVGENFGPASAYASNGHVELSIAFNSGLEPAPRTPTASNQWNFLSGTIKATYNAHRGVTGDDNIIVSPGILSGNTDTKSYWNLSRHIFRYNHENSVDGGDIASGMHTVNENIPLYHYLEIIRFFTTLIMNADEADFS